MSIVRFGDYDFVQSGSLSLKPNATVSNLPAGTLSFDSTQGLMLSNGITNNPVSKSGSFVPNIGQNNSPHTIQSVNTCCYCQTNEIVTVNVSYLINPDATSGRATFSDVFDVPIPPRENFPTQFGSVGVVGLYLGDGTNSDYGGGTVFTVPLSRQVEVFYDFASLGLTQVLVSVNFSYFV